MYVVSDCILDSGLYLGHPVIPLVINYGMPSDLQKLLRRLSQARHGYSSIHMEKHGAAETRVSLIVPLGAPQRRDASEAIDSELSMNKTQYEDLTVFLARVDSKAPDVIADLINLKNSRDFSCAGCYAVGEHRDNCIFDCPQAQE